MKSFIKKLIDKFLTRENISYVFWGLMTTLVSIAVYYALIYFFPVLLEEIANAVAIIISMLFAYIVNKKFVFRSKCPDFRSLITEFWSFISCRIFSAIVEELLLSFFLRAANINEYISKLLVCLVIFVLNYVMSTMFVFRNKNKNA